MTWLGWLRKNRRSSYELVCEADEIGACHEKLLRIAERQHIADSRCRQLSQGALLQRGQLRPTPQTSRLD